MTTTEFSNEFDILYESIASNGAPPIDDYEKSVLLTQAQEILVKDSYSYKFNVAKEAVDATEKRRRDLSELYMQSVSTNPTINPAQSISINARFFDIEDNVLFILQERVKVSSDQTCYDQGYIPVVPVTHDDYNYLISNPFKKPSESLAWRLEHSKLSTNRVVEIVHASTVNPQEYYYRYIKKPKPIIVSGLTGTSVDGISAQTECELSEGFHREILHIAVELALESTGNPRFGTKLQYNSSKTIN